MRIGALRLQMLKPHNFNCKSKFLCTYAYIPDSVTCERPSPPNPTSLPSSSQLSALWYKGVKTVSFCIH